MKVESLFTLPILEETEAVRDYAEDIFNRICNKKVGNVIGSIIEDHVLSFDDIDRLEKILEMKNLSQ